MKIGGGRERKTRRRSGTNEQEHPREAVKVVKEQIWMAVELSLVLDSLARQIDSRR